MTSGATEDVRHLVNRDPIYFDDGKSPFFGWVHTASEAIQRDCAAVICGPIGYEYAHSHRSIRHLADRLAQRGIPTIRFDYHGIGDSPGTDLDADRWQCWQDNIKVAMQHLRERSGRKRICLLGVRLGATLAALVASEIEVDFLVLWNPCVSGRRYLRELQAIASAADGFIPANDGSLESAGFVMSAETMTALRNVDLLDLTLNVCGRVLLLHRDDLSLDRALYTHLISTGVHSDHVAVPGYTAMMAEPQFTEVPEAAFSTIVEWVAAHSEPLLPTSFAHAVQTNDMIKLSFRDENNVTAIVEEQFCRFGEEKHLFGVLSRAPNTVSCPAIIFFNAGAVHHVGPNRLYVTLARHLATLGFACFRFDLEGIGDSVHRTVISRENHPYPDTAVVDAQAALDYLREKFGYTRFIALGLCSGAHTAFHTALAAEQDTITELVLINPLTFYWVQGMSLETTRQFQDALQYKKSARNPDSWRKLIRGKVNIIHLFRVVLSHFGALVKSYYDALRETLSPDAGPQLSQDLRRLFAMRSVLTMIIADGDPGYDILITGARRTALNAQKMGKIRLEMISDADHTFTQSKARKELVARLAAILVRQYGKDADNTVTHP